jgi:UDP-N-acetylglucosamine/UDP-N-acetylgalactosamine diphosphorylase
MNTATDLRERCEAAGQGHVFRFWGELDDAARSRLAGQVEALDLDQIHALVERLRDGNGHSATAAFEPPELFPLQRAPEHDAQAAQARAAGEELLSAGRVAYVLVAGGQGSRLGFDGPKGEYVVGPVTGRTLFGWHAARIQAARDRYGAVAPWYIMTSATNDAQTRRYFAAQDHFGLGAENVRFFQQRMLPALTEDGRVILSARDSLFLAPNGHGGTLEALQTSGCLADAAQRGIEELSYFQVDSPVARPADPLFLGLHRLADAEMSSKVVAKRAPEEKVGVLGRADGKLGCIEYSDLPDELRNARDGDGALLFGAGNIANHVLRRTFVERLTAGGLQLPWHLARKAIRSVDDAGAPTMVDGVKFETFVFDALGESKNSVTLEVERRLEFSPIKNAEGASSPATCRGDLGQVFAEWVAAAGGPAPPVDGDGAPRVEVDPRFAEDHASFVGRAPVTPREVDGGHLYT